MKKVFLVLPLAILLANCSSTRNANSASTNSGVNASASTTASTSVNSDASASATSTTGATASTGSSGSTVASETSKTTAKNASHTINWDVYDPNNFMQNPDKYRKPYEISKEGGWTYSKDWRRNTNFTADAVGEWQLMITPEVASYWMPDTRRPETYASFWTPEAVMARYQATVAAIMKTQDSIAALNASTAGAKTTSDANAATAATTDANQSTAVTGSGTTGTMGTGGTSSTTTDSASTSTAVNSSLIAPFTLTAVNGNNYLLPKLNLFMDNGSFTAYTGCNNALGKLIVDGSSLHFEEATPSSNIECIGGFDQSAFMDRLRRADSYDVVNNQFRIKQGDQVLMTFGKNTQKL